MYLFLSSRTGAGCLRGAVTAVCIAWVGSAWSLRAQVSAGDVAPNVEHSSSSSFRPGDVLCRTGTDHELAPLAPGQGLPDRATRNEELLLVTDGTPGKTEMSPVTAEGITPTGAEILPLRGDLPEGARGLVFADDREAFLRRLQSGESERRIRQRNSPLRIGDVACFNRRTGCFVRVAIACLLDEAAQGTRLYLVTDADAAKGQFLLSPVESEGTGVASAVQ